MRDFRWTTLAIVCLAFTGRHVAWAEPAQVQPDLYVEDPYAPHNTTGSEARLGTIVGFLRGEPQDVLALGMTAAGGYRFGRLTLESELSVFELRQRASIQTPLGNGDGDVSIGNGERLGVLARYDVIRFGPHVVGPNSLLSIYVEGGVDTAWNHFSKPGQNAPSQVVPDDTKRVEGLLGFGLMLDHRLQEPIGFPHRIAWFLGWRMAMSPHEEMTESVCRGVSCRAVMPTDDGASGYVDRSLLFQSSLAFTF